MLLNEFLKEHRRVEEQRVTIAQQKKDFALELARQQKNFAEEFARQQKQIEALTATVQIVSDLGARFLFYDSRRKQKSGRRRGCAFLVSDRIHRAAHRNNLSLVVDGVRLKQDNTKISRTCVVQIHHPAFFGPNKRAISRYARRASHHLAQVADR